MMFEDFLGSRESGRFLINPFWLEHLLNLFYQGHVAEAGLEIQDTICNHINSIEKLGYGIIGQEFDDKHLPLGGNK